MISERVRALFVATLVVLPSAAPLARSPNDLTFEGGGKGLQILSLIETAREVTGESFFFDPKDVDGATVHFRGTMKVPRERFLPFFDWCLRQVELVHVEQVAAGTTLHRLRRLGQQGREMILYKSLARSVTPAELRAMRDRGTLVSTAYVVQHASAREVLVGLQTYVGDTSIESIRHVEGTNTILMTGFASSLAALVDLADQLDGGERNAEVESRRELHDRLTRVEDQLKRLQAASDKRPSDR